MRVSTSASVAIFIYPCVCMNVFVLTDIIACVHTNRMYLQVMQEEGERSYHIFYQLASQAGGLMIASASEAAGEPEK